MSCNTIIELNPYVDTSTNELVMKDSFGNEQRSSIYDVGSIVPNVETVFRENMELVIYMSDGTQFRTTFPTLEELQEDQINRKRLYEKHMEEQKRKLEDRREKERIANLKYIWI